MVQHKRPNENRIERARVQGFGEGAEVRVFVNDFPVFLEGALPGEDIRLEVTSRGERYGHGELVGIDEASPYRVHPACPHYGRCGGCDLQHLAWSRQGLFKTDLIKRHLSRGLGTEPERLDVYPCLSPLGAWGHRGKIGWRFDEDREGLYAGLHERRSNVVVPLRTCPVQDESGTAVMHHLVETARQLHVPLGQPRGRQGLRALLVRVAPGTGEIGVIYVGTGMRLDALSPLIGAAREANAVQVAYNFNPDPGPQLMGRRTTLVWGQARLNAQVGGVKHLISPSTFFQTSAWGANALVETVRKAVPQGSDVLDLYCGSGLLTLGLSDHARRVVGIEEDATAVDDANKALKLNGFSNVAFHAGRAETRLAEVLKGRRFNTIVLDPPRAGAEAEVLEALVRHQPDRLVYVACDPHGLARDAALLAHQGYRFTAAQPIDMFPQTADVETVAIFEPSR